MSPVQHLPLRKAYADQQGLGSLIKHSVPLAMGVEAGTVVLAMVLATLSGRRPRYRLEECVAQQDTARLLGQAVPPQAWHDETAGRVLDRLYACGTMRRCPAGAGRAAPRWGLERREVPCDTTSRSVWGDSQLAETPALPWQVTYGSSKKKRPALKQCVRSTLCVDRAVPLWGQPEDGQASAKPRPTTLFSELAQLFADDGGATGGLYRHGRCSPRDGGQSGGPEGPLGPHPLTRHG